VVESTWSSWRAGKADQRPMQALSTNSQSASDIAPMALATGPIIQRRAALRNLTRRHDLLGDLTGASGVSPGSPTELDFCDFSGV